MILGHAFKSKTDLKCVASMMWQHCCLKIKFIRCHSIFICDVTDVLCEIIFNDMQFKKKTKEIMLTVLRENSLPDSIRSVSQMSKNYKTGSSLLTPYWSLFRLPE